VAAGPLDGVDGFVEGLMAEWQVPGLAVAAVKDGKVVLCKGYGFRDLDNKRPVTPRTLFAIASITKSFTAVSLATLADRGKLDWDAPVRDALPAFRLKDQLAAERVTVRDLLTHRTGLPRHDHVWDGSGMLRSEILGALRHLEPSRDLRAEWQYNNVMYIAAGCVDEHLSGRPWEDLVRDRVFRPLGMLASNFSVAESQKSDDHAIPYAKAGGHIHRLPFYRDEALAPAGGINSNAEEMARYLVMHIDGGRFEGKRVISRATAELLRTPQAVVPEAPGPLHAATFPELGPTSYGLGFFLTSYRGRPLVWHSGSLSGFSALFSFLPREKIGVVVLANLSGHRPVPICVTRNLFDRLLGLDPVDWAARAREADRKAEADRRAARKAEAESRRPETRPSHAPADYAGDYRHPAYGTVRVLEAGGALTLTWHRATAPLKHRHYDVFETAVGDGDGEDDGGPVPRVRVAFAYDPKDGHIDRLAMPLEPRVADIVFTRLPDPPPTPGNSR
jgi:CubicO group peptidase (beta-lactamase class C family)